MAYTPTTWVDNVTPVNAANLNKVEAGLDAADQLATDAQPKAEKAQVNGYASLDASGKVPLAQLPASGAELVFEGDYVPATTYQDGDYVVKDGVVYVCVGGPTTTPPDVSLWGGGPAGTAPSSVVSYGTSFPASPINGQEHILVDSLTAATYQWRFRYNASRADAYKWEFVGGAPAIREDLSSVNASTPNYTLVWTTGLVAPRAGEYEYALNGTITVATGAAAYLSLKLGPAVVDDADAAIAYVPTGGAAVLTLGRSRRVFLPAAAALDLYGKSTPSGTAAFARMSLLVRPLRVS